MKFHDNHFEDYINSNKKKDIHVKLNNVYKNMSESINKMNNMIFYGPSGVGKYTQMLKCIRRYSQSDLKYEKKLNFTYNKQSYYIKISDVHYEVDMSLLGCNSKLIWHEIYNQILDSISAKKDKCGIIVCKYFHEIHSELLDIFYSYMQKNEYEQINIKFILITEELSFIPPNIINCCQVVYVSRPSNTMYKNLMKKGVNGSIENVTNIKLLNVDGEKINSNLENIMIPYKMISDKIINNMKDLNGLNYLKFRDAIYDIFIYNLDLTDCIFYILTVLIREKLLKKEDISGVMKRTYSFFQYYNNNYRPIYHVENYLLYLTSKVHEIDGVV